jgi:hypothetical protein
VEDAEPQIPVNVNEMVVVPAEIPVTTPVALIVPTPGVLLLQTPPVPKLSDKAIDEPTQTVVGPAIGYAVVELKVSIDETLHPAGSV